MTWPRQYGGGEQSALLRLVLVEGLTHAAAAEQAGCIRTDVTQLVTSARRAIELARVLTSTAAAAPDH